MVSVPVPRGGSASDALELLKGLLASLPAAVAYVAGPELTIEFANDAYHELTGQRHLTGRPLREVMSAVGAPGRLELVQRIRRTGEPARGTQDEMWVRRGGQPQQTFVDYLYQPVRDSDGTVTGVLLYASDVTSHVLDRRRLESLTSELAASEERYRTLFETMPQGVLHFGADGSVVDANPAVCEMLGLDRAELATWPLRTSQHAVRADGSPFPPPELPIPQALRSGEVVTGLMGVPHGRTGELRWLQVTALPDARDADGRPQRAYGLIDDVTDQRRAEAALEESTALLGRLRDANVLGVMVATEEGIQEANDALLDLLGYDRGDVVAGRMSYRDVTPPEWVGRDREALAQLRRTGAVQPYSKEYRHRDGHRVPVLVGAAVVDRDPLRWATFVVDLTARTRAEREHAELLDRERAARTEAEQARERLALLQQAGALAAATRDRADLLEEITRLVVPSLADSCVFFVPAGNGTLRAAALRHRDPQRAGVLDRLRGQRVPAVGPLPVQTAYRTATARLIRDATSELAGWTRNEPGVAGLLAEMKVQSIIAMPLVSGQRRLGVLILGRSCGRDRFGPGDLEMVEDLVRRLSASLANAETSAREHAIAETLQRALLPPALPQVSGADLAVRYLPATGGADVGGDWYDAFPIGAGRVGLVVGDVVGHSIASAAIMGQIRSMVRAYALHHPDPRAILRRTGIAVAESLPETMATVSCAVLDAASGDFRYALAGHPPPLLIGGEGPAKVLRGASGIMLGTGTDTQLIGSRLLLRPGSAVLFYTDGLVEDRSRDIDVGLDALSRALAGSGFRTAEQICATAQDVLLGTGPRADDVCMLAVRRDG